MKNNLESVGQIKITKWIWLLKKNINWPRGELTRKIKN